MCYRCWGESEPVADKGVAIDNTGAAAGISGALVYRH